MIQKRIEQIEARVRASSSLTEEARAELLRELSALKAEAEAIPQAEHADLPDETLADEDGPITPLVNELAAAVDSAEAAHPRMTELLNRVAMILSNMGI